MARVKSDLDRLEKCLEEAESTVESEVVDVTGLGGGAASLRSFMPKLFVSKKNAIYHITFHSALNV